MTTSTEPLCETCGGYGVVPDGPEDAQDCPDCWVPPVDLRHPGRETADEAPF